jgi:hypothetical protein
LDFVREAFVTGIMDGEVIEKGYSQEVASPETETLALKVEKNLLS